ncbi:MAG: LicD family protein [Candidatus Neomarinimicrobiota bacterium]
MSGDLKLTGKLNYTARKMLRKVCGILDKHKIPYVLEGGTLLGIVRENRLLPWDNDLDLTITENYMDRILNLKREFWWSGYKLRIRKSREEMPHFPKGSVRLIKIKTKKYFLASGIGLMDIFVKKKIDDKYYWLVGPHSHVLKSVPHHFYENFTRYNFEGYDYSVPADYKAYLTYRYGDWHKAVKNYDYKKDDKSIVTS